MGAGIAYRRPKMVYDENETEALNILFRLPYPQQGRWHGHFLLIKSLPPSLPAALLFKYVLPRTIIAELT